MAVQSHSSYLNDIFTYPMILQSELCSVVAYAHQCRLLYLFNERWREREWRSAGLGEKSAKMVYDNDQMEYFDTAPKERWSLIAKWMNVIQ